jgi:hypothetical protein
LLKLGVAAIALAGPGAVVTVPLALEVLGVDAVVVLPWEGDLSAALLVPWGADWSVVLLAIIGVKIW